MRLNFTACLLPQFIEPCASQRSQSLFVLPMGLIVSLPRIKISVNTDISVIGFYGNIGKISMDIFTKISVDIFTKISVIKIFHILII